ncbi:MAG: hypothetical protein OXS50_11740, partial [Gammaproteobacteria bacterium]|nr:hypothetical protein [Gammaproteobacteria bacterium]
DFREFWAQEAQVQDRLGLIAEFLSEVGSKEDYPYITWTLDDQAAEPSQMYVNVGIWTDPDAFRDQIARYFNDDGPIRDFEAARRVRTVLMPKWWRIGDASLPAADSTGVL